MSRMKWGKKCRTPKTTEKQFDMMLNYVSNNKEIITGRFRSNEGPQKLQQLWEELSVLLNSSRTGPRKTADGWKKTWNEFKCNTKKRAREVKVSQLDADGGTPKVKRLSDRDLRLLSILSSVAVEDLDGIKPSIPDRSPPNNVKVEYEADSWDNSSIKDDEAPSRKRGHSPGPEEVWIYEPEVSTSQPEFNSSSDGSAVPGPSSSEECGGKRLRQRVETDCGKKARTSPGGEVPQEYVDVMRDRNVELANNTDALKDLAGAMREVADAIRSWLVLRN